jgi:beta-fructofuranosidase
MLLFISHNLGSQYYLGTFQDDKYNVEKHGREETVIRYDPVTKELVIDFIHSSINSPVKMRANCMRKPMLKKFGTKVTEQRSPLELNEGESLKLDIFIDRSIIEVFANGRQCVTQVVYPELENSTGVKLFSGNQAIFINKVQVWKMTETNMF